jgi:hypothetical protein
MILPKKVNICGIKHEITYVDKPSEVDLYKRESLWGQIDHWTRTIRVYDNGQPVEDVFETILHEILHGLTSALNLKEFSKEENHDELDVLALGLADTLIRNGWLTVERG